VTTVKRRRRHRTVSVRIEPGRFDPLGDAAEITRGTVGCLWAVAKAVVFAVACLALGVGLARLLS
jgi:hypothetical protein